MAKHFLFLICVHLLFSSSDGENITEQPLYRLMRDLFEKSNYSPEILPKPNGTLIDLCLEVQYQQLISLNEKEQILTSKLWIEMKWNSLYLKWNPLDYMLGEVIVQKSRLWSPRIVVWNSASDETDEKHLYEMMTTDAVLSFDGNVTLLSPVTIKTQCEINVRYFPFDSQTCKLTFGSWNLPISLLNISHPSSNLQRATKYFIENGEWNLSLNVTRELLYFECCPKSPFLHVTYHVNLKRRSSYYVVFIIVPYSIIAVLTLVSFLFPPDSSDRVSISITVLLAMSFYMAVIADMMPPSSHAVPLMAIFLVQLMVQVTLSLVATGVLVNCYQKTTPVPRYIKMIFIDCVSKMIFMKKKPLHTDIDTKQNTQNSQQAVINDLSDSGGKGVTAGIKETANTLAHPLVQAFLDYDNKKLYHEDWQFVTLVMNRMLAIFFVLATLISTLWISLQVP